MAEHIEVGKQGEIIALEYLKNKGLKIVANNWRAGHYELDLIAIDGENLVVVEVKTRSSLYGGEPEMAVNKQKQRTIIKAANAYVIRNNIDMSVRFDIIGILIRGENYVLSHIEDAFYPMM